MAEQPRDAAASSRARASTTRRADRLRRGPPLARPARRPTRYEERIADRTHVAAVASLRPLLAPASVAVVGASAREGSVGGAIYRASWAAASPGVAMPVHPDGGVVGSTRAARSLSELDEPPELAVVAVPAAEVLGVAREAARCGVRALLVVSAGFSDTDEPEGRAREEALLDDGPRPRAAARRPQRARASSTPSRASACTRSSAASPCAPGGLGAVVAVRRARPGAAAATPPRGGLGISSFVALGNRADVSTNDVLEHWADDERTAVVALYMESFGNPRRFSQVSRRVSRRKPILAVKGPARGARRAATRALATRRDALFRQAGVLRVESTQTLFDAAELLERQPLPARAPGRRGDELRRPRAWWPPTRARRAGSSSPRPARRRGRALAAALPGADRLGNPIDLGVRAPLADDLEAVARAARRRAVDAVLVLHVELGGGDPAARLAGARGRRSPAPPSPSSPASSAPAASCRGAPSWRVPELPLPRGGRARAGARRRPPRLARRARSARRPAVDGPRPRRPRGRVAAPAPGDGRRSSDGRVRARCCSAVGDRRRGTADGRAHGRRPRPRPADRRGRPQWRLAAADRRRRATELATPRRARAARRRRAPGRAGRRGARAGRGRARTRCSVTLGPAPQRQRAKTW